MCHRDDAAGLADGKIAAPVERPVNGEKRLVYARYIGIVKINYVPRRALTAAGISGRVAARLSSPGRI